MPEVAKTIEEVRAIIDQVSFFDRKIIIIPKGEDHNDNQFFLLQVQYMEEDIETGKDELQRARKWYLSPYSTETEIVETAFAACKRSMDHVLKEHFLYKGTRVYSPHFDINKRLELAVAGSFDARKPL